MRAWAASYSEPKIKYDYYIFSIEYTVYWNIHLFEIENCLKAVFIAITWNKLIIQFQNKAFSGSLRSISLQCQMGEYYLIVENSFIVFPLLVMQYSWFGKFNSIEFKSCTIHDWRLNAVNWVQLNGLMANHFKLFFIIAAPPGICVSFSSWTSRPRTPT